MKLFNKRKREIEKLNSHIESLRKDNYIIPKETIFGILSYPDFINTGGCSFDPGAPLITKVEYVFYKTSEDAAALQRDFKRLKAYNNEYLMTEMSGIKVIYKKK